MAPNRPEAARTAGSLRSLRTPWGCRVGAPSATEPRSVKAAEPHPPLSAPSRGG